MGIQIPVGCRDIVGTLVEGTNPMGSLRRAGLANYRLYGHTCLLTIERNCEKPAHYNSYTRHERLTNWVEQNFEKEVLTSNLLPDHGFAIYNERLNLEHPAAKIEQGKLVLPHTWRTQARHN